MGLLRRIRLAVEHFVHPRHVLRDQAAELGGLSVRKWRAGRPGQVVRDGPDQTDAERARRRVILRYLDVGEVKDMDQQVAETERGGIRVDLGPSVLIDLRDLMDGPDS